MPLIFRPLKPCDFGSFSIYVAPGELLREAVAGLLIRYRGTILCLQGTNHFFIREDQAKSRHITIKKVHRAEDLYGLIKSEPGSLTIIEHDGSLYDSHADQVIPISQACKQRSLTHGTVLLIAPRYDAWIKRLEPSAHNLIMHDIGTYTSSESGLQKIPASGQMVLTGW